MVDASGVAKELSSKLRGYDGLTAAKLADCPSILEALGTDDSSQALKRFAGVFDSLPDDKYTAALRNALRLDPATPASLTGSGGRRAAFGLVHSVSEETVKSWEARAIETLATALLSKPDEVLDELFVMFVAEDNRIAEMQLGYMWRSATGTGQRLDVKRWTNPSKVGFSFGCYQVPPDEQPYAIDVLLLFEKDSQIPRGAWAVPGIDFLTFISCNYQRIALVGPKPALDLVPGYPYADDPDDLALQEYVGYQKRWVAPTPNGIYGIAWYY